MSGPEAGALGRDGEAAFRRLVAVREMGGRGAVAAVFSPHPKALAEVRRRLTEVGTVKVWDGVGSVVQFVEETGRAGGRPLPVAWIEGERAMTALPSLNGARDRLLASGALTVLAMDRDRGTLAWHAASDLRSRAKLEVVFPVPPGRGVLTWLHLSDLHFGSTRGVLQEAAMDALLRDLGDERLGGPRPDLS